MCIFKLRRWGKKTQENLTHGSRNVFSFSTLTSRSVLLPRSSSQLTSNSEVLTVALRALRNSEEVSGLLSVLRSLHDEFLEKNMCI